VKHLFILREQLAPFETNFFHTEKEINFVQIRGCFDTRSARFQMKTTSKQTALPFNSIEETEALIKTGGRIWSLSKENPLLNLLQQGIPQAMVVTTRDSKNEVEKILKSHCDSLIASFSQPAHHPLSSFLVKVLIYSPFVAPNDL